MIRTSPRLADAGTVPAALPDDGALPRGGLGLVTPETRRAVSHRLAASVKEHVGTGDEPPDFPLDGELSTLLTGGDLSAGIDHHAQADTRGRVGTAGAGIRSFTGARIGGNASLSMGGGHPSVDLDAEVLLGNEFTATDHLHAPPLTVRGHELARTTVGIDDSLEAFQGAKFSAHATQTPTGASGSVEAFAGARAGAERRVTVLDQSAHVGGDVRAGIGGGANGSAGLTKVDGHDHLKLEGGVSMSLGVGGSLNAGVDLDVTPIANGARAIRHGMEKVLPAPIVEAGGTLAREFGRSWLDPWLRPLRLLGNVGRGGASAGAIALRLLEAPFKALGDAVEQSAGRVARGAKAVGRAIGASFGRVKKKHRRVARGRH